MRSKPRPVAAFFGGGAGGAALRAIRRRYRTGGSAVDTHRHRCYCGTMARRLPKRLRPELILDARELENLILECECDCRIELSPDQSIAEDAVCPCCGRKLDAERRVHEAYKAALRRLLQGAEARPVPRRSARQASRVGSAVDFDPRRVA